MFRPMQSDDTPSGEMPLDFLTLDDALILRQGLRGVQIVDVRQIGDHPSAGPEVVAFLEAEGLEASFRTIGRMVPPPLRRFVFRYSGNRAELTVTPGAGL